MSDSALRVKNRGAYSSPFSGVGVEFFPLGVLPDHSGFVLHEAGYLPRNDWWDFPNVLSPFWRLYYNFRKVFMSLIHTCVLCGVNPFDYLTGNCLFSPIGVFLNREMRYKVVHE